MSTNANSSILAVMLAASQKNGTTFSGLITTKRGEERGAKGAKVRYGNDRVHVTVVAGFSYEKLVRRSLDTLQSLDLDAVLAEAMASGVVGYDGRGAKAVARPLTRQDFEDALTELVESFTRTLDPTEASTSTTAHVYEPLVVDGEAVTGARVYKCAKDVAAECHCRNCTGDASAPLPGTIYLQGLQTGSKVLVPAANGPVPASQSAPKTVAKDMLRGKLPVRRYVSYALEPGQDFILRAGGTAAVEADAAGIHVSEDVLAVIAA